MEENEAIKAVLLDNMDELVDVIRDVIHFRAYIESVAFDYQFLNNIEAIMNGRQ